MFNKFSFYRLILRTLFYIHRVFVVSLFDLLKPEWPEGHKLAANMNFRWPQMVATPLRQLIPNSGSDGLVLMRDMLTWDPQKRPSCQQVSHLVDLFDSLSDVLSYRSVVKCFLMPLLITAVSGCRYVLIFIM